VLSLAETFTHVKDIGVSLVAEHGWNATAARERIRLYLIEYVGEVIEGCELEVVSGISDYPRRIRELRVEMGYLIASGASPDPEFGITLRPDQYLLVTAEPDREEARRWHIANRINEAVKEVKKRFCRTLKKMLEKLLLLKS